MLDDCCTHLDPFTQGLLQKLINNNAICDVGTYINLCCSGDREVITPNILRVEAALEEDAMLQHWQKKFQTYVNESTRQAYDKFRVMPGDIEHNIDWDLVKTLKDNEANGI